MRKCFSRAFALVMAVLMVVSQMAFVSIADDEVALKCTCEEAGRTGSLRAHVDPTCGNYGYDLMICDTCGGEYVVLTDLPTGQHVPNIDAPTCTEDKVCTACDTVLEEATGHNYVETVVDVSCVTDGYTAYLCDVCGDYYKDDVVVAPGHDWVVVDSKEVECFVDGYVDYECSVCGEPKTEILESPMAHINYVTTYFEATCYDAGYTLHTCNVCGFELVKVDDAAPALGHDFVDHEAKAPTCTEDGWVAYQTCTRCDYTSFEVDPATGHTAADAVVESEVAPTCTEDGSYELVVYCADCDYEFSRETIIVPATGHDYEVTTVAPTCVARGYDRFECIACDYYYDDNFVAIDPFAHIGEVVGRVEPTCTADGTTGELICTYCGEVLAQAEVIPMLDHAYVEHDAQAPTCTEIGWDAYRTCENCDYTEYVEIPAHGHFYGETLGVVAPECLTEGYSIRECEICLVQDKFDIVPANGHSLIQVEAQAPTCTEIGWDAYEYCTVCDYTTYVEIPANGHNEVVDEAIAPTCTEDGCTEGTHCDVCGTVLIPQMTVPATGHVPGEVVENILAEVTCVEDGLVEYITYCDVCDQIISRVTVLVPATDHTLECRFTTPTVDTISYKEVYCTVCGEVVEVVPVDEEVNFSYVAYGINGVDTAVNSGIVTVEVYADVVTEYARIFGFDVDLGYNSNLEFVSADGAMFNNFVVNDYANGMVKFTTDMGLAEGTKVFEQGKHLVATLTFKVAGDFYANDAEFVVGGECAYARDTALENNLIVDFGNGTFIHVARLGDITDDGILSVEDSNAFYEWFTDLENAGLYNFNIDMDKDGTISYADLAFLRGAIVHNDAYLEA